jgi:hypothetical protein
LEDGTIINIDDQEAPSGNARQQKKGDFVIEVRPSTPNEVVQKPLADVETTSGKKNEYDGAEGENESSNQQGKNGDTIKLDTKEEQPLSRAERRKRIKEEIMELSQGETPVYYQRRLW